MQRPRGLRISIHVSGTYQRIDTAATSRPITLKLTLGLEPASSIREPVMTLSGTLDAPGLADEVPITGTARISNWRRASLEYASTFTSNQGEPLQVRAYRRLNLRSFLRTRLALHAEIREPGGNLVARSQLFARVRLPRPFRSAT
jgi:hypothetical protein